MRRNDLFPCQFGGWLCLATALAIACPQLIDLPGRVALYSPQGRLAQGTICARKCLYFVTKNGVAARPAGYLTTVCFADESGRPYQAKTLTLPASVGADDKATVRYLESNPNAAIVVGTADDYRPFANEAMAGAALLAGLGLLLLFGGANSQKSSANNRQPPATA
jgi:hypothetical protein